MTLAVAVGVLLALAVVLALLPVRVRFSSEGRGDPTGRWAIAGGASVGPLALAAVAARGVPARAQVQIFRWTLGPWPLAGLLRSTKPPEPHVPLAERLRALDAAYERLARWVDPIELAIFLVAEKQRVRVGRVDVLTSFGDDDVALVGSITGGLHVLSTLLGPRVTVTPRPVWTGESLITFELSGDVTLRPGLFVIDVVVYLVKNVRVLPPRAPLGRSETNP